ncbi:MAG: hypothetical protein KAS97_10270 [Candidatus Aminicenantes bacterium]|nr:hypothetical protein [Candidatus Aminicenantes bacterium]
MVIIFTGPIGSGKTTQLEEWVKTQNNIAGILMPVLEGERHLYSIYSRKLVPVEIREEASSDEIIKIGKFKFSKKVFDWGNKEILSGFEENNSIIIDEIGPLEMDGKGFALSLKKILGNRKNLSETVLILVVREGMVEQITKHFNINEYSSVSSAGGIKSLLNEIDVKTKIDRVLPS